MTPATIPAKAAKLLTCRLCKGPLAPTRSNYLACRKWCGKLIPPGHIHGEIMRVLKCNTWDAELVIEEHLAQLAAAGDVQQLEVLKVRRALHRAIERLPL